MAPEQKAAALRLDPGDYTGTYKLIGGRPCLDLVNTVSFPQTARRHDWFDSPANVIAWAHAIKIIDAAAATHRVVHNVELGWIWEPPHRLDGILHPIVFDAADLLTEGDHSRIGSCDGCRWLFYDSTRNRSRRWCDIADCGSRDKALRYYRRTRGKDGLRTPSTRSA